MKTIRIPTGTTIPELAHMVSEAQGDAGVVALMDYTGDIASPAGQSLLSVAGVNLRRVLFTEPRDVGGAVDEQIAREIAETVRRTQAVDAMFVVRNAPDGDYT